MKTRTIAVVIAVVLLSVIFALPVQAASVEQLNETEQITYNADGSYFITRIYVEDSPITRSARSSVSATKETSYYSVLGLEWVYRVNGTFYYDGSTAYATGASSSYSIYMSGWSCTSDSASYSGNTATASGTFQRSLLTKNVSVSLTCDKNGNLS